MPSPVMWARPPTSDRRQQVEHGPDVDLGRLEQDLAEGAAKAPRRRAAHPRAPTFGRGCSRRVKARGGEADQGSPGAIRSPVTIRSKSTRPIAELVNSQPETTSPTWAISPPGISIPASLGAPAQAPPRSGRDRLGVGVGAEDEVEHRDRLRAHADEVVHVHRDAVDPDRLEDGRAPRHHHLGADPVGPEGDSGPIEAQDALRSGPGGARPERRGRSRKVRDERRTAESASRWPPPPP